MPENQTVWNFDNQEIKEKVNQNNQTSKNPQLRTMWVGLGEGETETQS